ncbi:hypothetical protein NW762_006771 [Fusarium torreyae]|uniref:Uncharacterized protein n=1 Tax=Fusarium torreyae TaxID=1237075 RepID=A0A9W8VHI0_9HYPO|nr:hypothetical protein NW762_006771 [Fusarium torreyae]
MASSPPAHGMMPPHDERPVAAEEIGRSRLCGVRDFLDNVDGYITTSRFGHYFRLSGSDHPHEIAGSTFFREVRAGLTTFATMAYIIAVNAALLSQSGGTCVCALTDRYECDKIDSYVACKEGESTSKTQQRE